MTRGPKTGQFGQAVSVDNVRDHWGEDAPDWIWMLARKCDETSQGAVAKLIGYSAPVISQVIRKAYRADMRAIERAVRGRFMAETVTCPVLGDIALHVCQGWQRKARGPFWATSSHDVKMRKACRNSCPHSQVKGGGHAE
jgi:hypothetical protein